MNFLFAGVTAIGVYVLAKGSDRRPAPSAAPPATDIKATLGGVDGADPDKNGVALSSFPAVGDGTPGGSVQTSGSAIVKPTGAFKPASGSTLTTQFTGAYACSGDCKETQREVQAAVSSVAPGMVY